MNGEVSSFTALYTPSTTNKSHHSTFLLSYISQAVLAANMIGSSNTAGVNKTGVKPPQYEYIRYSTSAYAVGVRIVESSVKPGTNNNSAE